MADAEAKVALLAGASGLAGSSALDALLEAPEIGRVFAVTRRSLGREHPRLANRIVQFEHLETQLKGLTCHVALCCLGAPRRESGTLDELRRVDRDYVLAFARAAKAAQAQRFVVLSRAGADAASKDAVLRIKAEMEQMLASLGFASLDILQPAMLLGWRREMHPLELAARVVMAVVNPLLVGPREVYRAIPARTVGAAMVGAVRSGRRGVQRYTYSGIHALSRLNPSRAALLSEPKARGGT